MPLELFNSLSDDQKALVGCAAALFICGTIMSLSYYVGRFFHRSQQSPEPNEPQTLRMPDPLSLQTKKFAHSESSMRRAA